MALPTPPEVETVLRGILWQVGSFCVLDIATDAVSTRQSTLAKTGATAKQFIKK